jgi:hypothetical protein
MALPSGCTVASPGWNVSEYQYIMVSVGEALAAGDLALAHLPARFRRIGGTIPDTTGG